MAELLVIKAFCPHRAFAGFSARAGEAVARNGGEVIVNAMVQDVQAIEPGSLPAHLWTARFPDAQARDAAWAAVQHDSDLNMGSKPLVLAMAAVPDAGLGDAIPTKANVPAPHTTEPTYLFIEGSASDQARMDRYRDIILPMMVARSSYYVAFELGGNVKVLSGQWSEAIFAISWWPSTGHAMDFWLSETYQHDAIPLRLDIGRFSVLAARGKA